MNQVIANQERRANGNGEPAHRSTDRVPSFERKKGAPDPIDAMRETADHLVRIATKAFMQMRSVDYETAQRWIAGAVERETKNKQPAPKSEKSSD